MNLKPFVMTLVLLPLVILNVILWTRGQEDFGFVAWGAFIAVAIWTSSIWLWIEIFKEWKRRRVEGV